MTTSSSTSPENHAVATSSAPDWLEADRRHVWHPYTQMATAPVPIPVVSAEGVYLHTAGGQRILDAISSWWVNIHGHNHPRLNAALARQAEKLAQVIYAGFAHEPGARLAEALAARAPGELPRVFYSDDGSTAVEVALKVAYQGWRQRGEAGRNLFVAFEHAYHGDTFGAMAAGGVAAFHGVFRELFFEVRRAACPCCLTARERSQEGMGTCGGEGSPSLEEILEAEGDRVAAVILEPMLQGAGGMRIHPPEFLARVRELTRRRGIPLIADEILTGFGRTGRFFASEHAGVEPDMVCVSKALTGGYLPLSATLVSEELYRAFLSEDRGRTLFHGHSFTGNALACAVALESLALFEENACLDRVARLEAQHRRRLARFEGHPLVLGTRALGAVAALQLAPGGGGGYLDELGPRLGAAFLERDVLLRPLGDVLYVLPPYAITDDEVDWVFDQIEVVLERSRETIRQERP